MILVDSSAFIEFYRPDGNKEVRDAVAEVISADQIAVNGIIQVEVVSFARGSRAFQQLTSDFQAFHWLELTKKVFAKASTLGNELRTIGITIPATDLIIASSAILANAELYQLDRHFDTIAEHSHQLRTRNLVSDQ